MRVDQAEQAPEGVVRGDAMLKPQIAPKPWQLLDRPLLDLDKRIRAGQHPAHRNNKGFDQVVAGLLRLARIGDRNEYVRQTQLAFRLHESPQKDRKLHKSNACEHPLGKSLIVNDYLGSQPIGPIMRLPWPLAQQADRSH